MKRPPPPQQDELPLISRGFLYKLTFIVCALLLVTVVLSIGGHRLGQRMALGGHTTSEEVFTVEIAEDVLQLPANVIRFAEQRRSGRAERVDLYLTWPGLAGYTSASRTSFDSTERSDTLIFLEITQSTMSEDMSGRLKPIYAQLFDGPPQAVEHGLTLHRLRPDSGYGNEVILTADRAVGEPYAVRCLLPGPAEKPTGGDCQRDIHIGKDLTVLYRFSSALLRQWDHIDAAVKSFVGARLQAAGGTPAADNG